MSSKTTQILFLLLGMFSALTGASSESTQNRNTLDLSGTWEFRIDPQDAGITNAWHSQSFEDLLHLPGCMQEQGHGNIPGPDTIWWGDDKPKTKSSGWMIPYHTADNYKIQHYLLPDRHYIGAAWYNRTFEIPDEWAGKRVTFSFERCHWESQLWLDGSKLGTQDSLGTSHVYDLGVLEPGIHRISLRVDNSPVINMGKSPTKQPAPGMES